MNKYKLFLILFVFAPGFHSAFSQALPPDNMQLISSLLDSSVENILTTADIDSNCSVNLIVSGNYNTKWLIEQRLFSHCQQLGIDSVYINSDKQLYNFYNMNFQLVELKIIYQPIQTANLRANRTISFSANFSLADENSRLIFNILEKKSVSDTVNIKDITKLENQDYPFTIGVRKKSLLTRLFEPLLITGITGTIIYIFYSFRSK